MIKIGTLCWLVNLEPELQVFSGRVVEVDGPLKLRRATILFAPITVVGERLCYTVTAPWITAVLRSVGLSNSPSLIVEPSKLKPFSDPDDDERRIREHTFTA